jgi:hypothetical protein
MEFIDHQIKILDRMSMNQIALNLNAKKPLAPLKTAQSAAQVLQVFPNILQVCKSTVHACVRAKNKS